MVAGAMVPWQMFKEILLFIAAAGDARASMRGTGIAWETLRLPAVHDVYIACMG